MTTFRTLPITVLALLVTWGCASAGSPDPTRETAGEADAAEAEAGSATALYTEEQARQGEEAYGDVCLECHTRTEFTERPFLFAWEGTSVAQIYSYIAENMPDDGPGTLPERSYLAIMAYILEMNRYPAGDEELSRDLDRMGAVPFEQHGAGVR